MAKFRVEAEFYCYIDGAGMQKHVLNKHDLGVEETPEKEGDQVELDYDKQLTDSYPVGTVFAVMRDEEAIVVSNYLWLGLRDNGMNHFSSAADALHQVHTDTHVAQQLRTGEYVESTVEKYNLMAEFEGNDTIPMDAVAVVQEDFVDLDASEDSEAPVTADGTTIEDAVKKALNEMVTHLDRPLRLSGTDNGMWSGKKIGGDMEICKDEVHDLLDNEARVLRAVFVVTLMDKK